VSSSVSLTQIQLAAPQVVPQIEAIDIAKVLSAAIPSTVSALTAKV
jgi:hypothetical protein